MMYASTKDFLKSYLDGLGAELQVGYAASSSSWRWWVEVKGWVHPYIVGQGPEPSGVTP